MTTKLRLLQTCFACPEQYDVFLGDDKVGYMRLRHGFFRAECHGGIVYSCGTKGYGNFEGRERSYHLNKACEAILHCLAGGKQGEEYLLYVIDRSKIDGED